MPRRVQLSRRKGWRMPPGAVSVARPTRWGNPFRIEAAREAGYGEVVDDATGKLRDATDTEMREFVVWCFRRCMIRGPRSEWWSLDSAAHLQRIIDTVHELADLDLACWCPLDQPCHADVLLALANPEPAAQLDWEAS